jgi:hypothetical protein
MYEAYVLHSLHLLLGEPVNHPRTRDGLFVEKMRRKLGFHVWWISLIMKCITTVTHCVKVNGEFTE